MQNKDKTPVAPQMCIQKSARERVGLAVFGSDALAVVSAIIAAEDAGIKQVWMTQGTPAPDTLSIYAAALVQTTDIRVGTAIVPTYPRHPLALAQQALALGDLAPGRLRLGVGPSHRPTIEGVYGIPMKAPLEHLREYVTVLRQALWEGKVDYQGHYYTVRTPFPPHASHSHPDLSLTRGGISAGGRDFRWCHLLGVSRPIPDRKGAACFAGGSS